MRLLGLVLPGLMLVGVGQMVFAAGMAAHTAWELSRMLPAEARVISVVTVPAFRAGSPTFAPVLAFRTAEGREVRARAAYSSSTRPVPGETWPIRYHPADPQRFRTLGFVELWLAPSMLAGMGAAWLGATWLAWRVFGRLLRALSGVRA